MKTNNKYSDTRDRQNGKKRTEKRFEFENEIFLIKKAH